MHPELVPGVLFHPKNQLEGPLLSPAENHNASLPSVQSQTACLQPVLRCGKLLWMASHVIMSASGSHIMSSMYIPIHWDEGVPTVRWRMYSKDACNDLPFRWNYFRGLAAILIFSIWDDTCLYERAP